MSPLCFLGLSFVELDVGGVGWVWGVFADLCGIGRGSPFLKKWMEFLEEEADLRYPNVADLQGV